MAEMFKSPLNYTGNKYRILNQIKPFFPTKIKCMVDLFCGGATVGLNVDAEKVIFVDNNIKVINLLKFLARQDFDEFLLLCEKLIDKYGLSYSYKNGYKIYRLKCSSKTDNNGLKDFNTKGFYALREDYNKLINKETDNAYLMLYLLMVYAFNNDIRFNSVGEFNLPIGKTDLNRMNVDKVKNYINKVRIMKTEFICMSFNSPEFENIVSQADFIYMDPPYLIGNAVYNASWNSQSEYALLDFIDSLLDRNINFALSNVIEKVGRINEPLSYWCHLNQNRIDVHHIEYNYRSASYNKITRNAKEQEILVTNKRYVHED
ncbi:MAG: Dam family site-specific DNA-(adenine-N6)-methyltransferase [Acholeplasma sp.]|nr:Dam family site-specific DNA-(adenine-N6)-methyltransferase [Acholeplasma sp.]